MITNINEEEAIITGRVGSCGGIWYHSLAGYSRPRNYDGIISVYLLGGEGSMKNISIANSW